MDPIQQLEGMIAAKEDPEKLAAFAKQNSISREKVAGLFQKKLGVINEPTNTAPEAVQSKTGWTGAIKNMNESAGNSFGGVPGMVSGLWSNVKVPMLDTESNNVDWRNASQEGFGTYTGRAFTNLAKEGLNVASSLINAGLHPIDTAETAAILGKGVVDHLSGSPDTPDAQSVDRVWDAVSSKYRNKDEFLNTLNNNPGKFLIDLSAVTGIAGSGLKAAGYAAGKAGAEGVGSTLSKLGEISHGASEASIAPTMIVPKVLSNFAVGATKVGAWTAGIGESPVQVLKNKFSSNWEPDSVDLMLGKAGENAKSAFDLGRKEGGLLKTQPSEGGVGMEKAISQAEDFRSAGKDAADKAYESVRNDATVLGKNSRGKMVDDVLDGLEKEGIGYDVETGKLTPTVGSSKTISDFEYEFGGKQNFERFQEQVGRLLKTAQAPNSTVGQLSETYKNLSRMAADGLGDKLIGVIKNVIKNSESPELSGIKAADESYSAFQKVVKSLPKDASDVQGAYQFLKRLTTESAQGVNTRKIAKDFMEMYRKYTGKEGFDFESYAKGLQAARLSRGALTTSAIGGIGLMSIAAHNPFMLLPMLAGSPRFISRVAMLLRLPVRVIDTLVGKAGVPVANAMKETAPGKAALGKQASLAERESASAFINSAPVQKSGVEEFVSDMNNYKSFVKSESERARAEPPKIAKPSESPFERPTPMNKAQQAAKERRTQEELKAVKEDIAKKKADLEAKKNKTIKRQTAEKTQDKTQEKPAEKPSEKPAESPKNTVKRSEKKVEKKVEKPASTVKINTEAKKTIKRVEDNKDKALSQVEKDIKTLNKKFNEAQTKIQKENIRKSLESLEKVRKQLKK